MQKCQKFFSDDTKQHTELGTFCSQLLSKSWMMKFNSSYSRFSLVQGSAKPGTFLKPLAFLMVSKFEEKNVLFSDLRKS